MKIVGLYRCIEQIAELAGWENLQILPKQPTGARKRNAASRSVAGTKVPAYALSSPVLPPLELLPFLHSTSENVLTEAMRTTEIEGGEERPDPISYYGAVAKQWEQEGQGQWKWTPEAVIYELVLRTVEELTSKPRRESLLTIVILYRYIEQIAEEIGGWHYMQLNPKLAQEAKIEKVAK